MCEHCDYLEKVLDATRGMLRTRDRQYARAMGQLDSCSRYCGSPEDTLNSDARDEIEYGRHKRHYNWLRQQDGETMAEWHERTTTEKD